MTRLRHALVFTAVAVAFADSSIVVLAVPEIVGEFDVDVGAASWVITAYNVAVVAAGALLIPVSVQIRTARLAAFAFAGFALASAGCAAATSFGLLVGCRTVQGAAAALLLVAALPLLGGRAGVRTWILAGTIGFAAGPALGGLLTEFFSWRSIFAVQAPLVALGLLALRRQAYPAEPEGGPRPPRAWLALATLGAVSAALVGALFLVVVLLVNGLGWQPLPAALVATTLPVLAGIAERAGLSLPARPAAVAGGILVTVGLATLAFLPGPRTSLIVAGLALCGIGLGLAAQPLGRLTLAREPLGSAGAWTVVARHAGLVVALVVVTPVLVSSLTDLKTDAEAVGGDLVLESQLPLAQKVPLLVDLAEATESVEADVPDLSPVFEPHETGLGVVTRLGNRLTDALHHLVTQAFRAPFLACAGFGVLASLLALGLGRTPGRVKLPAAAFVLAALVAGVIALASDFRLGALDEAPNADPCRAPSTFEGGGVDETTQRVALNALAGAACDLETSRASILRALASSEPLPWPRERLTDSVRRGLVDAVDAEREAGRLEGVLGVLLSAAAANAPLDWILDELGVPTEGG
ncbi:MAG TPA: MFS transporter [Gaiellaceae bacterium]|jgi:MFS family permease|nr:MFS transporter [Gaiellaceae bacterium]